MEASPLTYPPYYTVLYRYRTVLYMAPMTRTSNVRTEENMTGLFIDVNIDTSHFPHPPPPPPPQKKKPSCHNKNP